MTEKEKMLAGGNYFAGGEELVNERDYAKDLCFEFNHSKPSEREKAQKIINKLFGSNGNNTWIEAPFYCDYGYNISVGDNFYANHNLIILDVGKVTIGNNVSIAPNVGIYTAGHSLDSIERSKGVEFGKAITIGNNVWLGGNVLILPGVKIGDNTVIGAGSVVTKDVPANVIAVGNPCKVIKNIS